MVKRTVLDARVTDVEKRRYPSKHYVYLITVTWSDNAVNIIYRRYSKFFDFQMKLFALFPEEAGAKNPSQRMIPFLPEKSSDGDVSLPGQIPDELQQTIQQGIQKGKKLFGRSHTREVALRRLGPLDDYCKNLVRLPPKISDCDEVVNFFTPTNEDINPPQDEDAKGKGGKPKGEIEQISDPIQSEQYTVIADYKKQQKNEVDLHAGDIVEVFEKGENGWWFVSLNDAQGWAPGTFLAIQGGQDEEETLTPCDELFISNNEYQASQADEVSFQRGVVLNVVQKSLDGWWKVRYQEKEGWVPATYLQEYKGPNIETVAPNQATQIIGNVMNISDLQGRKTRPLPITPAGVTGTSADRINLARAVGGTDVKPTPPRRTTVRRSTRRSRHRYSMGDTNIEAGELTLTKSPSIDGKRYSYDDSSIREKTVRRGGTRIKNRAVKEFYTVADFAGSSTDDSVTFLSGQKVEVLQQTESGWWFVKIGDEEGWAPSTFIEERQTRPAKPNDDSNRSSNVSLASLDEETGERKPKYNRVKPQIGSSNGAFTPFTPHAPKSPQSGRSLPNVPENNVEKPAVSNRKPVPPPIQQKPSASGGGVNALRKQLEQQLNTGNGSAPPLPGRGNDVPALPNRNSEQWITVASYVKEQSTEIGFTEGTNVEIVEKDDSGWWLIRIGQEEGWAPSTFLQKV